MASVFEGILVTLQGTGRRADVHSAISIPGDRHAILFLVRAPHRGLTCMANLLRNGVDPPISADPPPPPQQCRPAHQLKLTAHPSLKHPEAGLTILCARHWVNAGLGASPARIDRDLSRPALVCAQQ